MSRNISKLFNTENIAFPWAVLGVVYLLLNFLVVGADRWEFPYGIIYALGFLSIAIVLNSSRPGFIAAICATITALLGVFISTLSLFVPGASIDAWLNGLMMLNGMFFIVAVLNELGYLEIGVNRPANKYYIMAPLAGWFLWGLMYFYARFTSGSTLNIPTILNHAGIMLLALFTMLRLTGGGGIRKSTMHNVVLALTAISVLGAFIMTAVLGWGLQLI